MKTRLSKYFIVAFLVVGAFVVNAQEEEEQAVELQTEAKQKDFKMSALTNPVSYLIDLISLGVDDSADTYVFFMDLEFQYAINEYFALSANPSIFASGDNDHHQINKYFQLTIIPGVLYHPFGTGLKGMYIGLYPNIGFKVHHSEKPEHQYVYGFDDDGNIYRYYDEYITESDDYSTEIGIGIGSGYKWIFKNGFTMELGGALGKTWQIPSQGYVNINSDLRISLKQFDFKINFKLGYSF